MANSIEAAIITLQCPNFRKPIKKSIGWITANRKFSCACGFTFEAENLAGQIRKFRAEFIRRVKKEVERAAKALKRRRI